MSTDSSPSDGNLTFSSVNTHQFTSRQTGLVQPNSQSAPETVPGSSAPATMTAAAAAALLLQAASTATVDDGSSNGSLPRRRSSAISIFEPPDSSASLPSCVITVAAQQAALVAAQALSSPYVSPSKATNLQAAVLSLALVANQPNNLSPESLKIDAQDGSCQALSDILAFSERHPELLMSSPTSLASVFRRRSSTILPTWLSNQSRNSGIETDTAEHNKPNLPLHVASQPVFVPNLTSAFENMGSHLGNSIEDIQSNDKTGPACDPYRFCTDPSDASDVKLPLACSPALDSDSNSTLQNSSIGSHLGNLSCDPRGYYRSRKPSPTPEISTSQYLLHHAVASRIISQVSSHSPTTLSSMNESSTAPCQPNSPLSCSSLSTITTPRMNISPPSADGRHRTSALSNSVNSLNGGMSSEVNNTMLSARSHFGSNINRGHQLIEPDYKLAVSTSRLPLDEPTRRREQRLIKNREAARECRRKKKEYVKCLEARVGLLESQNQQLIEELQKVKALCFNELCGLGLSNPTAVCAAAVLAAATSVSGAYSALNVSANSASRQTYDPHTDMNTDQRINQTPMSISDQDVLDASSELPVKRHKRRSIVTHKRTPGASLEDPPLISSVAMASTGDSFDNTIDSKTNFFQTPGPYGSSSVESAFRTLCSSGNDVAGQHGMDNNLTLRSSPSRFYSHQPSHVSISPLVHQMRQHYTTHSVYPKARSGNASDNQFPEGSSPSVSASENKSSKGPFHHHPDSSSLQHTPSHCITKRTYRDLVSFNTKTTTSSLIASQLEPPRSKQPCYNQQYNCSTNTSTTGVSHVQTTASCTDILASNTDSTNKILRSINKIGRCKSVNKINVEGTDDGVSDR